MNARALTELLAIGAAVTAVAWVVFDLTIHPASSMLRRAWYRLRRNANVEGVLAAAVAEMRAGCGCQSCKQLRDLVLEVQSRITDSDRAEFARIGVTWEGGAA